MYYFFVYNSGTSSIQIEKTSIAPIYSFIEPTNPQTGQYWFDFNIERMKYWDGSQWLIKDALCFAEIVSSSEYHLLGLFKDVYSYNKSTASDVFYNPIPQRDGKIPGICSVGLGWWSIPVNTILDVDIGLETMKSAIEPYISYTNFSNIFAVVRWLVCRGGTPNPPSETGRVKVLNPYNHFLIDGNVANTKEFYTVNSPSPEADTGTCFMNLTPLPQNKGSYDDLYIRIELVSGNFQWAEAGFSVVWRW